MATVASLPTLPAEDAPSPRDFSLARAIMELSPESGPAWVRGIGPALGPAADAMEALIAGAERGDCRYYFVKEGGVWVCTMCGATR